MNRSGKGEEKGREKLLSPTWCEKLQVIEPSSTRWRFYHVSVVCLQPRSSSLVHHLMITASVYLLPSSTITASVDLMRLGMECRWNKREAKRGTWERGILKYLGKKNEVNRSLPMVISHGIWIDLTTHKLWAPQSPYIYIGATKNQFSVFENTQLLFPSL